MKQIPDDPAIRRAEATGYGTDPVWPICPVCGKSCESLYRRGDTTIGCNECIHEVDAWEADECFPGREET